MPSIPLGTTFAGPNREGFKIIDFLGQGAFGEVYRAIGERSGLVVAVKLLPVGALASSESKIALLNEIRVAQEVKHPNVVQVLHVNDGAASEIGPYAVMEYISGGSLAQVLRAGTQIPLSRAFEMMIDIAQGTRAVNEKLIHRDIKPDNILIEAGKLKIGDFGISKFVDESTRAHTFKGAQHIAYMAPEGWQNQSNTISLDIYSVGLVFYEILTQQHPLLRYVGDPSNFLDWEKAHLYKQCPDARSLRNEIPLSIAQLLGRMVSKRPGDRPSWDEVLSILSQPVATVGPPRNAIVTAAVEAAVARNQELQKKELEAAARRSEQEKRLNLYRYSCTVLRESLNPAIEQFNQEFQHGRITPEQHGGVVTIFNIPQGHSIQLSFFKPPESRIEIRNGEVIGGGWIGLTRGRSANLVLLKQGVDDLYGRWTVCEIKFMALADVRKLIGQFGITSQTILPMGFKDEYFYDQIRYATGPLHVFTYNFTDDVIGFFSGLVYEACK